jgi:hypothetical protein
MQDAFIIVALEKRFIIPTAVENAGGGSEKKRQV